MTKAKKDISPNPEKPEAAYDAAPFPSLLPRRISDKQSHDWGLDEVAAKIPEGRCVMICGTKKP